MNRLLLTCLLAVTPLAVTAQETHSTMNHTNMSHDSASMMHGVDASDISEPGQGAFAAISEIVAALEADPHTDWSKVNISGLREHLRDMDVVMIDASATAEDVDGGQRFTISGGPDVFPSIQRMAVAHASVMQGVNDWHYDANVTDNGAVLTVLVPTHDLEKVKALGFFGVMASGMHHQTHHWMMATGSNPHG